MFSPCIHHGAVVGRGGLVCPPFSATVSGLADGGGWARGETGVEGGEIIADGGRRIMKSLPVESKRDDVQILGSWIDFEESD